MNYLHNDPRWSVKSKTLQQLHELAKPGAHLWPPGAIDSIVDMALNTKQPRVLSLALSKCIFFVIIFFNYFLLRCYSVFSGIAKNVLRTQCEFKTATVVFEKQLFSASHNSGAGYSDTDANTLFLVIYWSIKCFECSTQFF